MKNRYCILRLLPLLFVLFLFSFNVFGQVGIGTTNPNSNALLEIDATTTAGGLLLPRVALASTTSAAPLSAHVQGMTVYNTATAGDVTPGYYYNDGSDWVRIASEPIAEGWGCTGNAGTVPGTGVGENYLGTSDNQNLIIATNGNDRIRIRNNGNVGIGNVNASERLHVNGNLRLNGALMPNNQAGSAGQILLSNGAGSPPTWGAEMGNVSQIRRYVTNPLDIDANTINSITVALTGLSSGASAIINIQGNWASAIYEDITIHNIEIRTGEIRFAISNNTASIDYPGMVFNITVIR